MKLITYTGKSGKPGTYKVLGEGPSKFHAGKTRVHLGSMDGTIDFWVDSDKVSPASTANLRKYSSCSCEDSCCVPFCNCDRSCNCKGGNIYDC